MDWRLVVVQASAAFCLLAVIELLVATVMPGTAFHKGQLSSAAYLSVVSQDLVSLALLVVGGAALFLLLTFIGRVFPFCRLITRVFWRGFVFVLITVYVASWSLFWSNELFIGTTTLNFWWATPVQVLHWVPTGQAVTVFVLAVLLTVVLLRWLPHWVAHRSSATQRGLTLAACVIMGGGLLLAALGPARLDANSSEMRTYLFERDYRTGPFAHAFASVRGQENTLLASGRKMPAGIVRRPIISMPQYLAGVDHSKVKPWNVILIHIESLRSDQLRTFGGARDVMPAVDKLARESRVYRNAFIQASHSNYADPVSLSSHYPLRSREAYTYPKNPPYPRVLIYDVLKALGYHTAIFSSSNENWMGVINYLDTGNIDKFLYPETFDGPTYVAKEDLGFAQWVAQTKHAGSIDDRFTVEEANKWITSRNHEPFFIYLSLQSSHVPYPIPDDFPRRFGPNKWDFKIMWANFPRDKVDVVKDIYADSLYYIDTQLARLFDHLKSLGLWDRTVIVVGGDNGEAFYEHGFASHASELYNEVVKVPLIIYGPGLSAGADDRPAQHLDIPPTVLDLLGLPPHPSFQGISLLSSDPDPDRPRFIIVQTPAADQYAIVQSNLKLIFDMRRRQFFLYDLANDPGETTNLASARLSTVNQLSDKLSAWMNVQLRYYADPVAQKREYPPILQ